MASFASQLKDKFFGLVGRVTGCGRNDAGAKESTTLASVQRVEIRSRGAATPGVKGGQDPQTNLLEFISRTTKKCLSPRSHRQVDNFYVGLIVTTRCPWRTFKKELVLISLLTSRFQEPQEPNLIEQPDGNRSARDHLRAVAAAAEAGRREGRAAAPSLHAPVVRRRQRGGDAEEHGEGGGGGEGERRRRRGGLPVLRVARGLHRELPQEPGLRDHVRPPRHGRVRSCRGYGVDDRQLAVQEAGHARNRGGGRGVPGRGRLRRRVRVVLERAQQDRPDVHRELQRVRRIAHRQHRRGIVLRERAPRLVRRYLITTV